MRQKTTSVYKRGGGSVVCNPPWPVSNVLLSVVAGQLGQSDGLLGTFVEATGSHQSMSIQKWVKKRATAPFTRACECSERPDRQGLRPRRANLGCVSLPECLLCIEARLAVFGFCGSWVLCGVTNMSVIRCHPGS